ncbi:uncharacterized protein LOC129590134 [Paramacrobiotus metropolitanus]|uniref:uncharacterized protein LOC129590134 n=1 Tax=Paramacrobiotus metropolitanus TaxID=2943436 RepID=UPI0024459499|nr:uncharacterized protein LOC129590134 [Paramacrobiotus metropolitanus]
MDSDRFKPDTLAKSAIIFRPLLAFFAVLSLSGTLSIHAQPPVPPFPPRPVPLILRTPPAVSSRQNNVSAVFFQQSALSDATALTLPPTQLRLTFPPGSTVTPRFPNRIRFKQSALEPETAPADTSTSNISENGSTSGPADTPLVRDDGGRANRTALLNMSSRLLMREGMRDVLDGRDIPATPAAEVVPAVRIPPKRSDDGDTALNAQMAENNGNSGYSVGGITVGALIGIIAGILTALALAAVIGIVCYRRRHPTWNAAETDLRVLASHYGSYWDDKTLPNYQFNDRMTWPGDTHEEMIALDNDAFLKSLEDLGRVSTSSRPSSKSNWSTPDRNRERSTANNHSSADTTATVHIGRTSDRTPHRLSTQAHIHNGNSQSTKV